MFAKLFGENDDQVLITIGEGDDGPEVRVATQPPGYGVCSMAVKFNDSEAGWESAEKAFEEMDESRAFTMAGRMREFAENPEAGAARQADSAE